MLPAAIPAPSSAAAELRRAGSSVRVAVSRGAPITSFHAGGHEWCGAGPWQDYAPSAGTCALPTFVAGAPRLTFPEGGLLATDEPVVDVEADGAGGAITARWEPSAYPLGWTRRVALDAEGALCARYEVTNLQRTPLPFVWGMPVPLPWSSSVAIDIARGARARVAASYGDGLARAGSEFAWPALRDGGRLVDLTGPVRLGSRRAVLCYVELQRGGFVVRADGAALEISGEAGIVTHARVWVNNDADAPGAEPRRWWGGWWRRRAPHCEVAAGAAVGAPDLLSDAVGAWRAARWVEPGQVVRWTMRLRPVPSPT